jgi:predicted PurR-regulated permease PerM
MLNFFKNNNNIQTFIAYLAIVFSLFIILQFHVTPAILAGLLGYVITKNIIEKAQTKYPNVKVKAKIVGITIGVFSVILLGIIITVIVKALNSDNSSELLSTLVETLNQARHLFPDSIVNYIPDSLSEAKAYLLKTFQSNINSFAAFGQNALNLLLFIVIGWLIGILIACKDKKEGTDSIFIKTWLNLWLKLSESFRFVVFAQLKVAMFNSTVITIFLFIVSPILGWNIPYAKTLVLITFICGLLPIIGNLIANSIIFIIALTVSFPAAMTALGFSMAIHKLEYLIISKSLGADIGSDVWELLIVLFIGEILFGTSGLIFAPILYAFFKKEMTNGELHKIMTAEDSK